MTEFTESERLQNLNEAASLESMGHGPSTSPRIPWQACSSPVTDRTTDRRPTPTVFSYVFETTKRVNRTAATVL